jgi:transposase
MSKGKQLNFAGQYIYCGLDVHRSNWKVNARMGGVEIAGFSQNPDADLLHHYFKNRYPGACDEVVYEAGFCGLGIQGALGVECVVVNPPDVPSSDKERRRKSDKRDARKLARELAEGNLQALYVPDPERERCRPLVRQRRRLAKDQTRCKNRIRHLRHFNGRAAEQQRWSQKYVRALEQLPCAGRALKTALSRALDQYKQPWALLLEATRALRTLCGEPLFASVLPFKASPE